MSDKLHALARIFRLFRLLAHCFFPLLAIVPALAAFSAARAKPCIVIGAHFPL